MSATKGFGDLLDALGIWWPQGDGDALREAAATWTAMADLIDEITNVLDAAAKSVTEHHHGEAAQRFGDLWQHWSNDKGYLATTVADCRTLAAAISGFGTDVDVADRTLAHLVEQALDETASAITLGAADLWVTWLHDLACGIEQDLASRAARHAGPLGVIEQCRQPYQPSDPDRVTIDPARMTWPDPGTPIDLTNLTTTLVDFGAGQGTVPPALTPTIGTIDPTIPPPNNPAPANPLPPMPVSTVPTTIPTPVATTNIVVNGDGATINVNISAAGAVSYTHLTLPTKRIV